MRCGGGGQYSGSPRLGYWWPAFLILLSLAGIALADDFRIRQVQTRLVDGTYVLDATIDYRFSPEALEALANGVPLTILMQFQVRRANAWIWESNVTDLQLRYAIRHKPLLNL